jgi:hypothetical protein
MLSQIQEEFKMRNALNQVIDAALSNASDATGRNLMRGFQTVHRAGKLLFRRNNADQRHERNVTRCTQNNPNLVDVQFIMDRGYIHGQRLAPQCELEMGDTGNGGDNGCGPIAMYNAIYALNGQKNPLNPADIIYELEREGAFNLGGLAGTNPEAMVTYFRDNGRKADISYLPRDMDQQIAAAGVSILLYHGGGFYIHYVMIRHDPAQNLYFIYNRGSRDEAHISTPSVEQWAVTGIDGTSYRPLALITLPRN